MLSSHPCSSEGVLLLPFGLADVDDVDVDVADVDDIMQIPLTRASGFTEEKLLRRKCGFKAKPSFDPDLWPIRRLWRQLTTFITK